MSASFKKLLLLVISLFATMTLSAQTDSVRLGYVVRGTVLDGGSGRPVESVHVSLPGRHYATVTNADGFFSIKSDSRIDKIVFSCLGYKTLYKEVDSDFIKVRLYPEPYMLNEASIVSGAPLDIVHAAIDRIRDNYSDHPELLECFYRETIRKRNRYTYVSEAVAKMYKDAYDGYITRDRTALEKSRVLLSQRRSDTLSVKVQGGPTQAMVFDVVKNSGFLFNDEEMSLYRFEMGTPAYIGDRLQFVIHFHPFDQESSEWALYHGTMYIDREKLYFTRIEMSLDMSDAQKALRLMVVRKPRALRMIPKEMSIVVSYRDDGEKCRLEYFRSTLRFNCDWRKRLFATSYTAVNELVVTDLREKAVQIPRAEMFRTTDILSDRSAEFRDPDFWKDYNIIEPSESLEHAIDRLKKQQ